LLAIPQIGGVVGLTPEPEPPLGGAVPVPESATVFGDDGAVLATVSDSLYVACAVGSKVTPSDRLWFAASVVVPENPLTTNGAPACTLLTVTDALPVFVTVTVLEPLAVFSFWLPKFSEAGETVIAVVGAATPVPDTETLAGEFVALLATLTVPVTAPAVVGLKLTIKVVVAFGATVTLPMELALKPVPLVVTPEITTLEVPLFVSVTPSELLAFTVTLPKLRLVGLGASTGVGVGAGVVVVVPVPARETDIWEFSALLRIEMEPLTAPAVEGLNTAVNVALLPAAMVAGVDIPETLKPVPEAVTDDIFRLTEPVFSTVMVFVLLAPVATLPNETLLGDRVARARKLRKSPSCAGVACTATSPKTMIAAKVESKAKILWFRGPCFRILATE
jgi:hypothetical protein